MIRQLLDVSAAIIIIAQYSETHDSAELRINDASSKVDKSKQFQYCSENVGMSG